jgi:predicted dehydrogenase
MEESSKSRLSRRDFIKTSAVSLAAIGAGQSRVFAAGSDKIRVGLIGCGTRGTNAAKNCVRSTPGVEITAMGDVFQDRLDKSLAKLSMDIDNNVSVTQDTAFVGFDAYQKVINSDVDMVILATPPHFRPAHVMAAVKAGKHVFAEKPGAVDPVGVRLLIEAGELAKQKGISIVVGTQQRRLPQYLEIMKRIHNGEMGEIVGGQAYWLWNNANWHFEKRHAEWSDMEWQIRCWPYFTWLSGDHIVEQHLHNMDILNWAIGSHPVSCTGIGGRQARTGPEYGNIYDHFGVEYEYPNGVRVMSMCSQIEGGINNYSERVVGTKGRCYLTRTVGYIEGKNPYKYDGKAYGALQKEHSDLIESFRKGKPINEARQLAESTLTVIMGRMSAYTGRALNWDWAMKSSQLDLTPPKYEFGDLPVRPIAVPGKTKLV